jgi:ABC-type nickel/cobalt efflux system permease component RcnA
VTELFAQADSGFGALAPYINAGAAMAVVGVGAWVIVKIPTWKAADHEREMQRQKARDDYDRELREWHSEQVTLHSQENAETRASVKELTTSIGKLVTGIATIPCQFTQHSGNSLRSQS